MMKRCSLLLLTAMLTLTAFAGTPSQQVNAQDSRCFPETGYCIAGPVRTYWENNGGLSVFGYPVTDLHQGTVEGWTGPLQWFERDRLEDHGSEGVMAGRLGARILELEGTPWDSFEQIVQTPNGCLFFSQTGHSMCEPFTTYWQSNGGLERFGYPITEPFEKTIGNWTGTVQYFERRRMEHHKENAGTPYEILLGLLGNEIIQKTNTPSINLTQPTQTPTPQPTDKPPSPNINFFGTEINKGYVASIIEQTKESGVSWVRYNGINWNEVERVEGHPDWSQLATVENDIKALSEAHIEPMVIIRGTPDWAQKAHSSCGPIKEEKLDAFGRFFRQVVERYSIPPYNVKYWEMGNEPDVDPSLVGNNVPFGCWGDMHDPYYGGEYFAKMLQKVSDSVQDMNPKPIIVLGGLLLDCDPEHPPEGKTSDHCKPAKFLEGILKNGGGRAFDIMAFHAYAFWNSRKEDWDLTQSSWQSRGGAILGKLNFVQKVMQQYGVSKPIITNEIALLCWDNHPACYAGNFLEDQQTYIIRAYTRAWAAGLQGASWYTMNYNGWHGAGLFNADKTKRPAYETFTFLATKLGSAQFQQRVSLSSANHEGFIFRNDMREYQVYWSNDGTTFEITRPASNFTVYNKRGQVVQIPDTANIMVGFDPIVIEIR